MGREQRIRKANRSEKLPEQVRDRIANAVHQVILEWKGEVLASQACMFYALVGVGVLRRLTGEDYTVQAGSFSARITDDTVFAFDATVPETRGFEYHAWLARPLDMSDEAEIIDFSARHYYTQARRFGYNPTLPPPPDYIWSSVSRLKAERRYRFRPDVEITEGVYRGALMEDKRRAEAIWSLVKRALAIVRGEQELPPLPPPVSEYFPQAEAGLAVVMTKNADGTTTPRLVSKTSE
jgi:hypothetical protein